MKVKLVETGKVIPYARNPRNNEKAVDSVAASIKEYGWRQPIVVDAEMVVIAGHTRLLAAQKLGLEKVPVHIAEELTDTQVKAYRIADNRTSEAAEWDQELLKLELQDLKIENFELGLTGFNNTEIEQILMQAVTVLPPAADPEAVPAELPIETNTVLGDTYEIGSHRLQCGDSTQLGDVSKLMGVDKAHMVFTDPPYGMSYGGGRARGEHSRNKKGGVVVKAHGEIIGDDKRGLELVELVRDSISSAIAHATPESGYYICFPWRTYREFLKGVEEAGLEPKACIVWDKKSIGLGTAHYRPQHEFIFYCKGQWYGGQDQADVWSTSRGNTGDYVHPTQKPIELIEKAIQNSSKTGDIVLDVFGGSGSTMVACQQLGRMARLMELDPKYCDAIVNRMHKLWPSLPIKRNGVPINFEEAAK